MKKMMKMMEIWFAQELIVNEKIICLLDNEYIYTIKTLSKF
jgi:hypothetical protein